MLELLETFRVHFAGRPLLLCLVLTGAAWLVLRRGAARPPTTTPAWLTGGTLTTSVAALWAYVAIAAMYANDPHYFDPAEPTMTAVAWLYEIGRPLYHDVASAERYAHIYGPMAFMAHGLVLGLFGPSIVVSKALGAVAALASLACVWLALRRTTSPWRAVALTGGCALAWLLFRNYTFWTRPEPLQLLCVSAGLLVVVSRPGALGAVSLGVCAGVLWNLKITGPLYTLPLFVLLAHRAGVRATAWSIVIAGVTAAAPFAAPNVSFDAYLTWIRLSARNGLLLALLRQNTEWAVFLAIPLLAAYYGARPAQRPADPEWRQFAAALGLAVTGVAVAASKPGAGPYHLTPFVPLVAFAIARVLRREEALAHDRGAHAIAAAWLGTACLVALAQQASFASTMAQRDRVDETADLRAFVDSHPGLVVELGYAGDDRLTFARPELVFRTGAYTIDAPAVQEHQLSGIAIPAATLDAVRSCRTDVWLIPRGAAPFEGLNRYSQMALAPLFSDAFRSAFREAYVLDGATRYYDIWRCRTRPAS